VALARSIFDEEAKLTAVVGRMDRDKPALPHLR